MNNSNAQIRAIFASLTNKRIRFYQNILKDIEEQDEWAMRVERLIAHAILLRNIRDDSKLLKEKVIAELENLMNEETPTN